MESNLPPGSPKDPDPEPWVPYAQWLNGLSYTELLQEKTKLNESIQTLESEEFIDPIILERSEANLAAVCQRLEELNQPSASPVNPLDFDDMDGIESGSNSVGWTKPVPPDITERPLETYPGETVLQPMPNLYTKWALGLSYTELLQERSRLCDIIQSPQSHQVTDQETLEQFRANLVLVEALMANMKGLLNDVGVHEIVRYRALCQAENDISETVNYLRLQMAGFGPMRVPVNLAMQLKKEETKLARVREELKYLEHQLLAMEEIPADVRTEMDKNRIMQLQRDIEAKRKEETFYEKIIALLEMRAAELGADLTPDVNNEIDWSKSILDRIRAERILLESRLSQVEP